MSGHHVRPLGTPTTPALWLALCCEQWRTSRDVAEGTWSALMRSRWSQPVALRQWVLAQPFIKVEHFTQTYTPHALVEALEALVRERRLARALAVALEDAVLAHVDTYGHWSVPTT